MTDEMLLREALEALQGLTDHLEQIERGHSSALLSPSRITQARTAIAKLEQRLLKE